MNGNQYNNDYQQPNNETSGVPMPTQSNPFGQQSGGSMNGYNSPSATPKKSNKGLIIGAVVAIVAIVVAAVVAVIVFMVMGISKKDYQEAIDNGNKLYKTVESGSDDIASLESKVTASGDNSATYKELADKMSKLLSELDSDLDNLSDDKAIQKDEEAKAKYDKLAKSYKDYKSYMNDVRTVYLALADANNDIVKARELSNNASSMDEIQQMIDYANSASTKMGAVKVKDSTATEALKSVGEGYSLLAKAGELAMQGDSSYYTSITLANSKLLGYQTKWSSFMMKGSKNGSAMEDAYNALGKYLTSKVK